MNRIIRLTRTVTLAGLLFGDNNLTLQDNISIFDEVIRSSEIANVFEYTLNYFIHCMSSVFFFFIPHHVHIVISSIILFISIHLFALMYTFSSLLLCFLLVHHILKVIFTICNMYTCQSILDCITCKTGLWIKDFYWRRTL